MFEGGVWDREPEPHGKFELKLSNGTFKFLAHSALAQKHQTTLWQGSCAIYVRAFVIKDKNDDGPAFSSARTAHPEGGVTGVNHLFYGS